MKFDFDEEPKAESKTEKLTKEKGKKLKVFQKIIKRRGGKGKRRNKILYAGPIYVPKKSIAENPEEIEA